MQFGLRYKVLLAFIIIVFFALAMVWFFKAPAQDSATDTTTTAPVPTKGDELVSFSNRISLPLPGSAPEEVVYHTIAIDEIRQGCVRQDCIPAVDLPEFLPASEMSEVLSKDSIGIALSYQGEHRFYPFPMLETHELVNDMVAGDPLLISYCPLCGTGIVFDRRLDGEPVSFGVSGMLWQSNLLMYNRAAKLSDRNLWSQVLGQAVVGNRAGQKLTVIPSDIMRFGDWAEQFPNDLVLTTGTPQNPYDGDYYEVASLFEPDFDPTKTDLPPDAYVYGVIVDGQALAIPRDSLPEGVTRYTLGEQELIISRTPRGVVEVTDSAGNLISDVEGFWFSWQAAHPDTILWSAK